MRAALLLALTLAACSAEPKQPANETSPVVAITLPADTASFPATPAGELVTVNCTACHSVEMIRQQPPLTADKWAATVKKMRETYHAPVAPDDDKAIVDALMELQGKI